MSEEKTIQHLANALHVLQNKDNHWIKRVKEFLGEILIIVFAVSITLVLHNWNDERHERRLAREFLQGIKTDLDSGAVGMKGDVEGFQDAVDYYDTVRHALTTHQPNTALLDSNSWRLMHTSYFVFDMGRFEAFKSSGYLRLIENPTLLKQLMNFYTTTIPFQVDADRTVFDSRRQYYNEHIGPRATFVLATPLDGRILVSKMLDDPWFRYFIIHYTGYMHERRTQKLATGKEMKELAAEIGKELAK